MSITSKANNPFPQVEEKQGAELLSEYLNSHQEVLDIIESRVKVEIEQSILEIHFNLIQYNCIDKLVTLPEIVFTTDNSNPFYYGYKENKIYINTKYLIFNFISRHKITKKEFLQNKDDIIKSVEFIGAHIAKHEYGHHLQWSMFSKETMGRYLDKKDLGFRQRVETQAIMFSALFFIVEKHNRKNGGKIDQDKMFEIMDIIAAFEHNIGSENHLTPQQRPQGHGTKRERERDFMRVLEIWQKHKRLGLATQILKTFTEVITVIPENIYKPQGSLVEAIRRNHAI